MKAVAHSEEKPVVPAKQHEEDQAEVVLEKGEDRHFDFAHRVDEVDQGKAELERNDLPGKLKAREDK